MRINIDRLKQLLKKTKEYKEKFYTDRDKFFYSKEAEEYREDLTKRYEELKSLVVEANDGYTPTVSMLGYTGVDIFANVYSEYNSVTAFHCLKIAPQFIIKAIAYHGGKKVTIKTKEKTYYINPELINKFKSKKDKFDYGKLVSLLKELNINISEEKPYSTLAIIRSILDHIPPLFGTNDFSIVASNYKWSRTDKEYMKQLLNTKAIASDVLHRPISDKEDLINMDCIPKPILLTTLLTECLNENKESGTLPRRINPKPNKSKIKLSLSKNELTWDNYAEYNGPSFLLNIRIDNYENNVPDFITKATIKANSTDGEWVTKHFKFSSLKTDSEYKIEAYDIKETQLYLSDGVSEGIRNSRKMPDLDRDTFKLVLTTRSGQIKNIAIKPGWVKG